MNTHQPGILAPVPAQARYLSFVLASPDADPRPALARLAEQADGDATVVGLGASLLGTLGQGAPGLVEFPAYSGAGLTIPATPASLWLWLRGEDRGELLHRGRALEKALAPAFELVECVDAFRHGEGRDITGYEDGTENPKGDEALAAAFTAEGGSFVAVQRWRHDLARFDALAPEAQDHAIGRRKSDNEELEDAPESAHVKRTAQESFEPEAFVLRRSMPWVEAGETGLMFVAFGRSLDAFTAQLRRMTGQEDGITDALFTFTRPVTGAFYWCPPVTDGRLDLSRVLGR
ncbi:MAG: Dyp-type peroxidase [Rhodocyclaceae bacterium]|nr:Dyp-type peroxidase [Rhodocyclaceae bacterium]